MTCVHKVRWSVKRPEDCRFRLSVSHYKDRIVAPDEYSGATVVTPSDTEQVLPTTDKLVRDDITINPAPTEYLSTDHNGTFTPSDGKVGFSEVDVNVVPDLRPLTIDTLTQHGTFLPTGDGFSQVTAEEDWDEILYPVTDETDQFYDLKVFNSKNISVKAGDRLIVEGLGRGVWSAFPGGTSAANRGDIKYRIEISFLSNNVFTHARYELVFPADVTYVLAGYEWSGDGVHSSNGSYCFYGEYLKYKIIRASSPS